MSQGQRARILRNRNAVRKRPAERRANPSEITLSVVTAVCGRSDECYSDMLANFGTFADKIIVVCHEYFADNLPERIYAEAGPDASRVMTVKLEKSAILRDGFSGIWNAGIGLVDTDWFMIAAADERVADPSSVKQKMADAIESETEALSVNLTEDNSQRIRIIRVSTDVRYSGLVHEEMETKDGRGFGDMRSISTDIKLIHNRKEGDRSIQSVLLLKAFYNEKKRGRCHPWWFETYLPSHWDEIVADAQKATEHFGIILPDLIEIPLDWDHWRSRYDVWPFKAHQLFYDQVYGAYPNQTHGSPAYVISEIGDLSEDIVVLEFGPWTGNLAAMTIESVPRIRKWYMAEICPSAVKNGFKHEKVEWLPMTDWPWNMDLPDATHVVAMHVIEHMRVSEFQKLVEKCKKATDWIVEIPLSDTEDQNWNGYCGTHIFEKGWNTIESIFSANGFKQVHRNGQQAHFRRTL